MIEAAPLEPRGTRDAAVVALGYCCALRRSELCALEVADLRPADEAWSGAVSPRLLPRPENTPAQPGERWLLRIRRSKTDQEGDGYDIPLVEGQRIRPLQLVQWWLYEARIEEGPLFRSVVGYDIQAAGMSGDAVNRGVWRLAAAAGLETGGLSAHSLRVGFITSAVEAGAELEHVMQVSRHRSYDRLLDYVRRRDLFADYAGGFL